MRRPAIDISGIRFVPSSSSGFITKGKREAKRYLHEIGDTVLSKRYYYTLCYDGEVIKSPWKLSKGK